MSVAAFASESVYQEASDAGLRTGKELILATRPFAREDRVRSYAHLFSSFAVLAGTIAVAAAAPWAGIRLASATLAGLTTVRVFILFHDVMHGAILRGSILARIMLYPFGLLVMTPPRVWRETHNYHHAHTAKIVGSHVGSYATTTTTLWARMSPANKLKYRIVRHPLTILFGYFTVFMTGMCLSPFLRSPRRAWDAGLALALNIALTVALLTCFGVGTFFYAFFFPLFIAMATGAYLFYAQHNFPGMHIDSRERWSYTRAALESSSYMRTGPLLRWFTGNIGYHHVHHLNPAIPFYRLPEAMAAIPELQTPRETSLSAKDIAACLRIKMWDPVRGEMVGYPPPEGR